MGPLWHPPPKREEEDTEFERIYAMFDELDPLAELEEADPERTASGPRRPHWSLEETEKLPRAFARKAEAFYDETTAAPSSLILESSLESSLDRSLESSIDPMIGPLTEREPGLPSLPIWPSEPPQRAERSRPGRVIQLCTLLLGVIIGLGLAAVFDL